MDNLVQDQVSTRGEVERRLYSSERFYNLLKENGVTFPTEYSQYLSSEAGQTTENLLKVFYIKAREAGLEKDLVDRLLEDSAKVQFKDNLLWRLCKKYLNIDLVIPFITGRFTKDAIKKNIIVNTGHKKVADQLGGTTTAPVTAIALGTGAVAAAATDSALGSEITTSGGQRGAATVTNTTTSTTGDTEQWVKTFTFTGTLAVTEEGLFDNNTSGGIMAARQVFSAVNVVNGDTLQITHKIQC